MKSRCHNFNFLLTIILFLVSLEGFAQVKYLHIPLNLKISVETNEGDIHNGILIKKDSSFIVIRHSSNKLKLKHEDIKSIHVGYSKKVYKHVEGLSSKYFIAPSAIPLKKKQGYYQNIYFSLNHFKYGLTDNFSIGGMVELTSLSRGVPVVILTPKLGFKIINNFHVGGGVIIMPVYSLGVATLSYSVITLGSFSNNITLGGGILGLDKSVFIDHPVFMASFIKRMNKNISIVSENYYSPIPGDKYYFGIHGLRIFSKKGSFDVGAIFLPSLFDFPFVIPYLGLTLII